METKTREYNVEELKRLAKEYFNVFDDVVHDVPMEFDDTDDVAVIIAAVPTLID